MDKNPKFKWGRLALAASFLTVAFGVAIAVWSQSSNFEITLAGQSMIRSDIRVHTPTASRRYRRY